MRPFLPLIHGLCAFFRPLGLLTLVSAAPSLPASQFTVRTLRFTRLRLVGRFASKSILASEKPLSCESTFQKLGYQRGLDANHANFNANRREDAIRASLANCFKNRLTFANRFARIDSRRSAERWCANRLPIKPPKKRVYTNFSEKFARTLAFFPVTPVRNAMEILQKTCSDELYHYGWAFSGGFSSEKWG